MMMNGVLLLPLFMFLFVALHFINPTAAAANASSSSSKLVLHNLQHEALLQTGWWCPNITSATDHCEWPTITCNVDGFVTHIRLGSYNVCNSLSGIMNIAMLNLSSFIPFLIQLDLSGRGFRGSIPSEIGMLSNLQYLYLYNNFLTGELPLEIGNLTQLRELDVSYNELSGQMPPEIGLLHNLKWMDLSGNSFVGSILSSIANLTLLKYLDLSRNRLDGIIPPEVGNLKVLYRLDVSHNNLTGSIPSSIGKMVLLETLYLEDNHINGLIPPEIGDLLIVNSINLSRNLISGEIPSEIGNLRQLDYLDLSNNNLSGRIPTSLSCLLFHRHGQHVYLENNSFTEQFLPACLTNYKQTSKCYDQDKCFSFNKVFYIKLCVPIALLSILGFQFLYLRNHNAKNSIRDEATMLKV